MRRLRRPGYLAGYRPFGKGMMVPPPSAPTPPTIGPVINTIAVSAVPQTVARKTVTPEVLTQLAALKARVEGGLTGPGPAKPSLTPPAGASSSFDEEED